MKQRGLVASNGLLLTGLQGCWCCGHVAVLSCAAGKGRMGVDVWLAGMMYVLSSLIVQNDALSGWPVSHCVRVYHSRGAGLC